MGNFYLDIETTGLNEKEDKILTIQYQELDSQGRIRGHLVILKSWESSEKDILERFIQETGILTRKFQFIPVGYNLGFEHNFFKARTKKYGLPEVDILNYPFIDFHSMGVLMNQGMFKGASLDKLTGKPMSGSMIPLWYQNKEYEKIIEYIEVEAREFLKLAGWLWRRMPLLFEEFKKEMFVGKELK
jgi:hypothetical protein